MAADKDPLWGDQEATQFLGRSFYQRPTLDVAQDLLGAVLVRREPGRAPMSGWITETEAYIGEEDLACHGRHGRTERNRSMWGPAGHAYVYFTYGMHWMLNFVTEEEGFPAAVLIRGLLPGAGRERIRDRRSGQPERRWTDGPAKLCQAFAIDGQFDGLDLCNSTAPLFVTKGITVPESTITRDPRVGLNNVPEPWLSKPWRLRVARDQLEELLQREGEL